MFLRSKEGKDKALKCKRYTDITFRWKKHGDANVDTWVKRPVLTIREFDELFQSARHISR